jgi:glucose/arabinose dehydrogenase
VTRGVRALALFAVAACGSNPATVDNPTPTPTAVPCSGLAPVAGTPALTTSLVARGFVAPLDLQSPPGDCRLFVVEQGGQIRLVRDGGRGQTPFLDVSERISSGGERGLLGLAFHPRYAENGRFFVNYTDRAGDTHIAEFHANPTSDVADDGSEKLLIFVKQPFANHNGGGLAFGADGFLYIGLGDGGSGGDPQGNGQNVGVLLGKMLRIDVDHGSPYGIPPGNPFAGRADARPEIWAYGLRNPWRFTFDRATDDLLIADVGQNAVEEIDLEPAPRRGDLNYGWNILEGSQCFSGTCDRTGLTPPVLEYTHAEGCAVMGGAVYRGPRLPGYQGTYFYSDYCTPFVRSFRVSGGQAEGRRDWTTSLGHGLQNVTAYGTDASGEVYIVDQQGSIYEIVPAS